MTPRADPAVLAELWSQVEREDRAGPVVLGICGAQGSGKSTLARAIEHYAALRGMAAATLSLDDLYLARTERQSLARAVHPLLRTRGVPGTHDVALGLVILAALDRGDAVSLPRFDKARDDRAPRAEWHAVPRGCRLLILEGWCVGARPQPPAALVAPVNALEANEDADGRWRAWVNAVLADAYQLLFARIDILALLAAPGFDVVFRWRQQQEAELRGRVGADAPGLMDDAALRRFIQHYERLTRHILAEMPGRADVVVRLDQDRVPIEVTRTAAASH